MPQPQSPKKPTDKPTGATREHTQRNRWVLVVIFVIALLVILLAKYGFDTLFKGLGILTPYWSAELHGNHSTPKGG
jgi:energy-coupling factor transporter transmembrane protein EcfT